MSESISRRDFLRHGSSVTIGARVAIRLFPVEIVTILATDAIPGYESGNAGYGEAIEEGCKDQPDPKKCVEEWQPTTQDIVEAVIEAPVKEEAIYRLLPSVLLDTYGKGRQDATPVQESLKLSRRELRTGLATSLVFALEHNRTATGFNTRTIPASQFLTGMAYWWLQRKHGVVANVTAHATGNAIAVGSTFL